MRKQCSNSGGEPSQVKSATQVQRGNRITTVLFMQAGAGWESRAALPGGKDSRRLGGGEGGGRAARAA